MKEKPTKRRWLQTAAAEIRTESDAKEVNAEGKSRWTFMRPLRGGGTLARGTLAADSESSRRESQEKDSRPEVGRGNLKTIQEHTDAGAAC